jgi:inner membrane protein
LTFPAKLAKVDPMEPITHFLTGAALSRAGFNRKTALATVTMTLAAEAPDIDAVAYFKGTAYEFIQHRGITHTFYAVPFIAALVVGVVWLVDTSWRRLRPRRKSHARHASADGERAAPPRRWGLLFLFACIAVLSHLLLDFTNNYGLRPFYPFARRWHAWDIVFIFDPLIFAVLLAAAVLPRLFALIDREIGARQSLPRGRGGAIAALLFIAALWGVRDVEHRRAVAALEATEFHGERSLRVGAFPYMLNPFRWAGVVETADAYHSMRVDSLHSQADSDAAETYYKPQPTQATQAARNTSLGRAYMEWARFPLVEEEERYPSEPNAGVLGTASVQKPEPAHVVRFLDVRFLYPESRRRPLAAYVLLDSAMNPVEAGFEASLRRR